MECNTHSPHEGEICLLYKQLLEVVHHLRVHHHTIHGRGQVTILIVLQTERKVLQMHTLDTL